MFIRNTKPNDFGRAGVESSKNCDFSLDPIQININIVCLLFFVRPSGILIITDNRSLLINDHSG